MQRAIFLLFFLFICAGAQALNAASPAQPSQLIATRVPILYVHIISFQDITTGEQLIADVYAGDILLAKDVHRFEYTIEAGATYTVTFKANGYQDFGMGITAAINRDQQTVIPLYLERE